MLSACASAPAPTAEAVSAPNPVIARTVEVRTVCPPELDRAIGALPQPEDGAVLTHNDAGGRYFDAIVGWAVATADLFNDARAACPTGQ